MNVLNAIASRFQQFKNYIWRDKRRAVVLPVMVAFYAVLAHWFVIGVTLCYATKRFKKLMNRI